jgi:hypothetical protein
MAKAIKAATNAVSNANRIWLVTVPVNTRPTTAPPKPPAKIVARTLAVTEPSIRDKAYLLLSALRRNLYSTRRPTAWFCGAQLSRQEAEITGNVLDPSGLANTDAAKPAIHR